MQYKVLINKGVAVNAPADGDTGHLKMRDVQQVLSDAVGHANLRMLSVESWQLPIQVLDLTIYYP